MHIAVAAVQRPLQVLADLAAHPPLMSAAEVASIAAYWVHSDCLLVADWAPIAAAVVVAAAAAGSGWALCCSWPVVVAVRHWCPLH